MEKAPVRRTDTLTRGLLLVIFGLVLCAAYSNTLTSPPYLDDFHSFIFEKSLYLKEFSLSTILSLAESKFGLSRYIPVLTFALNHKLGQSNLIYFHMVNIAIHLLAFLAVFFLARQILAAGKRCNAESIPEELTDWLPILIAALWALSPAQTSAVTYLVQRMAALLGLFYFLAIGCYIKARLCSADIRPRAAQYWYFGFILASTCAFLSKENAILIPLSVALTEIWFFDSALIRKSFNYFYSRSWKIWLISGIAIAGCLYIASQTILPRVFSGYSNRDFSMLERFLTEGRIIIWYISILIWPDPRQLSMEHHVDISTSLLNPLTTLLSLLIIIIMIGCSIYYRKKHPLITFGVLWFFINLSLESTILPLELVFEHRLYVPSFGIFLSSAIILGLLCKAGMKKTRKYGDYRKAVCSVLVILASCSALMTFVRNEDWQTSLSIQYDAVLKAPKLPRAHANYANALVSAGQFEEAKQYAEKAITLSRPGLESYGVATNALVIAHLKQGDFEGAIQKGTQLIDKFSTKMDADSIPLMYLNMAQAYMGMHREREAYQQIMESLRVNDMLDKSVHKKDAAILILKTLLNSIREKDIDLNDDGFADPGEKPLNFWIAMELRKRGDLAYSRQLLEEEFSKDPENTEIASIVGALREQDTRNSLQKAKWNFEEKYVRRPFSKFNFCMAVAFLVQERHLSGIFERFGEECLETALAIESQSPDALLLKGWYFYSRDDFDGAVQFARKALVSDPDHAKVWLGLGFFLLKSSTPAEAAMAFNKVIEIYPGYSKRSMLETVSARLKKGESVESISSLPRYFSNPNQSQVVSN
ncbi:MAG: tetratricopeptide repeat protein [Syntrophobacteraceae bacterium]